MASNKNHMPGLDRLGPLLQISWDGFSTAEGFLDLLGDRFRPTFVQRVFDTRVTAAVYDYVRDLGLRLVTEVKSFSDEVAIIEPRLAIAPGHCVLDLACGHGNFTVEWARRVGDKGLVVGLDISRAMLRRAVRRVRRSQLVNVALVRGDALELPFREAVFDGVNCSGGFHQLPDLPRAISEIARVLKPGGMLTASTFARSSPATSGATSERATRLHFVDLGAWGPRVESAGFEGYQSEMRGRSWGYLWARRSKEPVARGQIV